jgi:hypothetical protein
MFANKNEIIYYILILLLFFVIARGSVYIGESLKLGQDIGLILGSLLFTGLIYLLKNNYLNKDNFYFELTPEKKCDGGPYMYSSDPERQKLCSQFSPEDLANYQCNPGFHGRPVWWQRSDESDSKWQNGMCGNPPNDYTYPAVL